MPYVERQIDTPSDPRSLEAYALAYKEQLQARGYATQSVQYTMQRDHPAGEEVYE